MPTPREAAQKHNQLAGEPKGYCGTCGVPSEHCDCGKYKEHGANATNAGSEHADDPFMGKNMSEKKAGEEKGDEGKASSGGNPFGKKE